MPQRPLIDCVVVVDGTGPMDESFGQMGSQMEHLDYWIAWQPS